MHKIVDHFADPVLDDMIEREILVDNRENGNELEEYQVNLVIDEKQLFFEAQDGLRFVDENLKIIDHWNESFPSKQWQEVPKIPPSAICAFRMLDGNPSANSASSGDDTFTFFDDFEDESIDTNKWSAATNGVATEEDGVMKLSPSGDSSPCALPSIPTFQNNVIETRLKIGTSAGSDHLQIYARSGVGDAIELTIRGGTFNDAYIHDGGFVDGPDAYEDLESYTGIWHRSRFSLNGSAVSGYCLNEQTSLEANFSGTTSVIAAGTISLRAFRKAAIITHYDWVFIRGYASPEPSAEIGMVI